jgi:hypothetical protein
LGELYHSYCEKGEDIIEEVNHGDDAVIDALPFDEVIQAFDAPAQEKVNKISYFPLKYFDDALFYDLEGV